MIKFIIVDDDEEFQNNLKNIILKTAIKNNQLIEINCFKKYNSSLQKIMDDNSQRKIFILDIDLKSKLTGINIALKIRENDWDSEIIFLTCYENLFEKVYRNIYKVFDFIEKHKNMEKRLIKDINTILKKKYDVKMYKYSNRAIDLQIYLKDILYIFRDTTERKLVMVTTNNKFLINKSISSILKDLDKRFVKTHRSCIANIEHVNLFKWNEGSFILDNKKKVYLLSKKYKEEILKVKNSYNKD